MYLPSVLCVAVERKSSIESSEICSLSDSIWDSLFDEHEMISTPQLHSPFQDSSDENWNDFSFSLAGSVIEFSGEAFSWIYWWKFSTHFQSFAQVAWWVLNSKLNFKRFLQIFDELFHDNRSSFLFVFAAHASVFSQSFSRISCSHRTNNKLNCNFEFSDLLKMFCNFFFSMFVIIAQKPKTIYSATQQERIEIDDSKSDRKNIQESFQKVFF